MTSFEQDAAHQTAWRGALAIGGLIALYLTWTGAMHWVVIVGSALMAAYGLIATVTYIVLTFGGAEESPRTERDTEPKTQLPTTAPKRDAVPGFVSRDGGYTRVRENNERSGEQIPTPINN